MGEQFAQDGHETIAGVGYPATVNDFTAHPRPGGIHVEGEPGRKGTLYGIGTSLYG